jgi:predicted nucleotidyltransferase
MIEQARSAGEGGAWPYLVLFASGAGLLAEPWEGADSCPDGDLRPVREVSLGDGAKCIVLAKAPYEFEAQEVQPVEQQLGADDPVPVREMCAQLLGRLAKRERSARAALLKALDKEHTVSVRESIAYALRFAASDPAVQRKLIQILRQKKEEAGVRAVCARALRSAAFEDEDVRGILLGHLGESIPAAIRIGAVGGLTRCVPIVPDLQDKLFGMLKDEGLDDDLRVQCLYALDDVLPSDPEGIGAVSEFLALGPESFLAVAGATVLAEYAATERVPWRKLPIEKIEQLLVSTREPYEHVLGALRSLVDAREVRRLGLSREKRIEKALEEHRERIQAMFIFGSSARGAQGPDSDIDVMVIGDVTLKELTPALKRAEIELGRQVNAVLYSADEWKQRTDEGNPFVANVSKADKVFVMGEADDLR